LETPFLPSAPLPGKKASAIIPSLGQVEIQSLTALVSFKVPAELHDSRGKRKRI
jgi:hypothetical protein